MVRPGFEPSGCRMVLRNPVWFDYFSKEHFKAKCLKMPPKSNLGLEP